MMWDPLEAVPPARKGLIEAYGSELLAWNARINLVSRRSASDWLTAHVRHSLCLARRSFPAGATVVDWGTGGGLPAIPLAIAFPDVRFIGVDATAKKVAAVEAIVREIGLDNVEVWRGRAEEFDGGASHAVSRATAPLGDLWAWSVRAMGRIGHIPAPGGGEGWESGLVCLKGGDLADEIRRLRGRCAVSRVDLHALTGSEAFRGKYILHVTPEGHGK